MNQRDRNTALEQEIARQLRTWQKGVRYEIEFWDRYLAGRGGPWSQDFERRMRPEEEVDCWLLGIIERIDKKQVRVLDVGAGPICCLGKTAPDREVEIVAVDPLAPIYDCLLERYGICPPLRTEFAVGEDLGLVFSDESFDIVHCQNALDHSFDPLRAIRQMLSVCKTGGYVLLRHAHNEAETENYSGFHQWNLTNDASGFIVWNKEDRFCVDDLFGDCAEGEMLQTKGYLINAFRKVGSLPVMSDGDAADRFLAFQKAMMIVLGQLRN